MQKRNKDTIGPAWPSMEFAGRALSFAGGKIDPPGGRNLMFLAKGAVRFLPDCPFDESFIYSQVEWLRQSQKVERNADLIVERDRQAGGKLRRRALRSVEIFNRSTYE